MKYVISVSKTYKHRGRYINHLAKTKKYWHIFYYEYNEIDEVWKTHFDQVGWFTAMYYKSHKWKKQWLTCPDCQTTYMHFIKKRTDKQILKQECPDCFRDFKDLCEEAIENS